MDTIRKLFFLLSLKERNRAALLVVMVLLMAVLDALGVASIMPFMAVLANPEMVVTNDILNNVYTFFGFDDIPSFLFALGSVSFLLLVGSLGFKALTTYAQLRFTLMREYTVSKRLVEGYLNQPFSWFLNRNSAELGTTVLSEVGLVINSSLIPMMTLLTQSVAALAVLALLISIDTRLALTVGCVLALAYALILTATRGLLGTIGADRLAANAQRYKVVNEAFGAAKEVKVHGLEHAYTERFSEPARKYAAYQALSAVISQLPRFALEAIGFGGMLLVMLYLMLNRGGFEAALPIVALYAFAGYRLLPALQQIYGALTSLRFSGPALETLHRDLQGLQQPSPFCGTRPDRLQVKGEIALEGVSYYYANATKPALNNIDIVIPAKSTIGLVGSTGSGKTTTVDVILGLLEPQEGRLSVDGQIIDSRNRRAWQRTLGYVPQQIYLADDSVAANIAFGVPSDHIDQEAVERAAQIANLHSFVLDALPQGYATSVGERGVRLSGGQRQRIGIARALYHSPQVLILDEATSALDNLTEQAVMDAVNNLGQEITIVLIAHRLSTVRECDNIIMLEHGAIAGIGRFDELAAENEVFNQMTGRQQ